jgi:hypothetical protein
LAAKTVYVELVAQTKKFNAGLAKAEKRLGKTKAAVAAVSTAILAVGAVALRSLVRELENTAAELDEMGDAAKALQTKFAFLEDLQFIAKRLGSDEAGLGVIRNTMLAIDKAASEAASGSKQYTDEFAKLGLNAKEFIKLDPETRFLALRDAFAQSAKGAEELAALQIIAGRGAKGLLNVFGATREEFADLIKQRRAFGGFTEEGAELAGTLDDVWKNLDQIKRGLKDEVFRAFGPVLLEWYQGAQKFVLWLRETGYLVPILKVAVVGLVAVMAGALAALIAVGAALAPAALLASASAFGAIAVAVGAVGTALAVAVSYGKELINSIDYVFEKFRELKDNFGGTVLKNLGFGGDASMAERAAWTTSAPVPSNLAGAGGNSTVIQNNISVEGQTAEQMQSDLRRRNDAQRRGKRR